MLFNISRPNWTIAGVFSWAFGFIYKELQNPNELIMTTFAPDIISGVAYTAVAVSFIIVTQVVIRLGLLIRPTYNPYKRGSEIVNMEDGASEAGVNLKISAPHGTDDLEEVKLYEEAAP